MQSSSSMLKPRVIPCLLLKEQGLIKTKTFKSPVYIGDPINAVKIFNDKEVDELVILDIYATAEGRRPQFSLIREIASECFMPLGYGGGIRTLEDINQLFAIGVEKVLINSCAVADPQLVAKASSVYGNQGIVVSIDVGTNMFGQHSVYTVNGTKNSGKDPVQHALAMEKAGAGEILLNSINRDGTMLGYDTDLIAKVSRAISIPVIACGGAGKIEDFADAIRNGGAAAVAAGSMFVFHGKHRAVLITYPPISEIIEVLGTNS